LRIPILIHQQDLRPGLANKMMAPFAKKITVCFESSQKFFDFKKTRLVGNPVRQEIKEISQLSEQARRAKTQKAEGFFGLESDLPVILVVSGSQGAIVINEVVTQTLPRLLKFCQVIHITGKRQIKSALQITDCTLRPRYHRFEFMTSEMIDALMVADLIISRAGMSSLTEYAYLKKVALLIPVYNSHQEDNARYFQEKKAAQVLSLRDDVGDAKKKNKIFIDMIRCLLDDRSLSKEMKNNISGLVLRDAEQTIARLVVWLGSK